MNGLNDINGDDFSWTWFHNLHLSVCCLSDNVAILPVLLCDQTLLVVSLLFIFFFTDIINNILDAWMVNILM